MKIKNWPVLAFVGGYHLLLLLLLPWVITDISLAAGLFFLATYSIGGLTITAGYHRLFSHKTYAASAVFEWLILIGSTLAVQSTALIWAHDHRLHHKHVDTDKDPYSIKKGFWYAHILWLFIDKRDFNPDIVPDLMKNPRVMFQHKYYLPLTIVTNLAVVLLACWFMHPVMALFSAFLLRVFAIHHSTWFINSLAHTWGAKTYVRELSAMDNAALAFLTFGEGYHNFHHAFAGDYRNGVRWWHFDPTKWLIMVSAKLGLVKNLRRVNRVRLQQVLLRKDKNLILKHLSTIQDETAQEIGRKLEELSAQFESQSTALRQRYAELKHATTVKRDFVRIEIRRHRRELRATWRAWSRLTKLTAAHYGLECDHHAEA
jgi:stearoyl-CoA desaturase (delta-9 desaturase)